MSDRLEGLVFTELLERFAARTPAPGGGSAAATSCALAAALVEMAARFSTDATAAVDAERAAALRVHALELIERDAAAFAPVLEAAHAATTQSPQERSARVEAARLRAAEPPLAVARLGAELAELAAVRVEVGNRNLTGDAVAGASLAEAGARSAAALVQINLAGRDDPRLGQVAEAAQRAATACQRALKGAHEE